MNDAYLFQSIPATNPERKISMSPSEIQTFALKISINAVSACATRVHGRSTFTFEDASTTELIQALLMRIEAASAVGEDVLDNGEKSAAPDSHKAVADALGIHVVKGGKGDEDEEEHQSRTASTHGA